MAKPKLDTDRIARGLGAQRKGKAPTGGGSFGALQVAAHVRARFRGPTHGGRATDPRWTERRLVPLAPETLERLERLCLRVRARQSAPVEPMQLAALLLEDAAERMEAVGPGHGGRAREALGARPHRAGRVG